MAKRFGGKYSPQGKASDLPPAETPNAYTGAQVSPVGARANLMFVPPVVLIATTVTDGAVAMTQGLISAGLLALAAFLLREGLKAEAAFNDRKAARRPAIPRKIFAAVLCALGAAGAVVAHQTSFGLIAPVLFASATAALHLIAFGIDPLKSKGMEGVDTFQQDRVARVVDEAEQYLSEMSDAMRRAGDRQMESRLETFQTQARKLIRTVEDDPRDLTAARKYLGVYLMGARDATAKFADIFSRSRSEEARQDYAALLDDLSQNFAARTEKLLTDDRTDLTVEIDVLRDRLGREGVRLSTTNDAKE